MNNSNSERIKAFLLDNIVVILFLGIAIFGITASGGGITGNYTVYFISFFSELIERVFRNSFLVISLMIPVIAGLGLNFGIVIGAIAAQSVILLLRYHQFYLEMSGIAEFLLALLLSLPLAILFGWLTGKLYNKVRGQEMIAGMIVSYFAAGVYNLVFLFIVGYVIEVDKLNPIIAPANLEGLAVGVRMTVDMGVMTGAIDNIIRIPFMFFIMICAITMACYIVFTQVRKFNRDRKVLLSPLCALVFITAIVVWNGLGSMNRVAAVLGFLGVAAQMCFLLYFTFRHKRENPDYTVQNKASLSFNCVLCSGMMLWAVYNIIMNTFMMRVRQAPFATALLFAVLFIFLSYIMKTKLGQDFRAVGQSQHIAEVSGINVKRTRIIATIFSTVLAAWGMVIFLQNMGTLTTYDSHRHVGFFSVAAILVGGASTSRANLRNVITGLILFHAMTIVTPDIARIFFGDTPGVAEYLRSFMVYGVIGLALGLYVWKTLKASQSQNSL
ncbi:MAG: hypothetical protein FWE91_09860 [Defluviitaleaceae bacterium]|nr:hypothetical protein [Defluviitaleaceae bacterium]MCL2835844.1 hypothetical protein [Defluviitaleaceae bacterium]